MITQVMKRFLSCGELQQNRHQGIPRQTGGSALTNPKASGMGTLLARTTLGLLPCRASLRSVFSITSAQPAAPIDFSAFIPALGE